MLWRDHGLAIEVDGFATHKSRRAFEHDRALDARRAAHGVQTLRITWRRLTEAPESVVADIAAALALARAGGR